MRKVLLVDDSALFRKIVTMMFAQRNELELVYASSYKEAEDILRVTSDFFASIVCIVLPDAMNGEMVDLSISHNVPTLVLTSSVGGDIREQMARKPIIDYISKNTRNDIIYAAELIQTLLYFENKKVLIVTDNETERKQLFSYFSTLLLKPIHVENSTLALKMIKEEDIDIIATDYKMSGMDGLKLVQNIRGKYTKEQKIIFAFTSSYEQNTNVMFLKYGANEIISKPFSKEEFNARVFKELDFKKTVGEAKDVNKTIEKYVITSTTDENGIIKQVSDAFCEVSGYTRNELLGKPQNIVRHPDMPSEVFKELWSTIKNGDKWRGTVKNRKKDGGYYWVIANIEPIFNSQGSITGYRAVRQDITAEKEVEEKSKLLMATKQKLTDSIKFSSLIQHALLPEDTIISNYYSDFFILWDPKDVVGGDIYLFMAREDSCLLFVIDCAGHGVPGAFMTIITKNILDSMVNDSNFDNPALILQQLSNQIRITLKQDNPNSKSDAGLDGGILHYNKKTNQVTYAGAKTPLFYIQNNELKVFKSDRESIGYKKSNIDFKFTNHVIDVDVDSYFYITSDGFIDQNGGEGGFVLGKKKVQKLIHENYKKDFVEQREIFHKFLLDYQGEYERDDDVNFVGFSIKKESDKKVEHFFKYTGFLTQETLGDIEKILEEEHKAVFDATRKKEKLLTIFYELGQNIIKYAVQNREDVENIQPTFEFLHDKDSDEFDITCKNVVSEESMLKIKSRIDEANSIDKEEISTKYKELRRSQQYAHSDGAGLGFFEFAKRSKKKIRYNFDLLESNDYYYSITITI